VCIKKIPAASKFLELKKLNERKFSFVIFLLLLIFNGAKVMHIFDCTKKCTKYFMKYVKLKVHEQAKGETGTMCVALARLYLQVTAHGTVNNAGIYPGG
jgi:hypothetical protein